MAWATLGEIEFEVLNTPQSLTFSRGWNFVEHSRIDGKPTIQRVGGVLSNVNLGIRLHRAFTNPQERIDELIDLSDEQKPLTLVLADINEGEFVITNLEIVYQRLIAGDGQEPLLLWADLSISLLEHVLEIEGTPLKISAAVGFERFFNTSGFPEDSPPETTPETTPAPLPVPTLPLFP